MPKPETLESINSRTFIRRFNEMDRNPAEDPEAREAQIVVLTRRILPVATSHATDEQVLRLHRDYLRGLFG